MGEKRCYTVKELQEILDVSRATVYELLKKNEFRWIQVGGKYRISKKSFDEWLDGGIEKKRESVVQKLSNPVSVDEMASVHRQTKRSYEMGL